MKGSNLAENVCFYSILNFGEGTKSIVIGPEDEISVRAVFRYLRDVAKLEASLEEVQGNTSVQIPDFSIGMAIVYLQQHLGMVLTETQN